MGTQNSYWSIVQLIIKTTFWIDADQKPMYYKLIPPLTLLNEL